jgi:hypothetical protein
MIDAVCFRWRGRKQLIEPYLRTAVDFLLAYNVLLRSESRLAVEFLDFFTIPLPGEGPTPCFPMIVIMDNDKINPLGRLGYGTVSESATLYDRSYGLLFYRWNIAGETPPCSRRRQ